MKLIKEKEVDLTAEVSVNRARTYLYLVLELSLDRQQIKGYRSVLEKLMKFPNSIDPIAVIA